MTTPVSPEMASRKSEDDHRVAADEVGHRQVEAELGAAEDAPGT
jgi:hypothetical protein